MSIFANRTQCEFWENHEESEQPLKSWYQETENATWANINELKIDYPKASILSDNRIVFNIKGIKYRLIVKFNFDFKLYGIRFVGIHAEYDKINANKI